MKNLSKKIHILGQGLYRFVFAVLIVIAAFVALSAIDIPGNYKLLSVQSGSMEPAISRGSVVITKPPRAYQIGDVITFRDIDNSKYLVTHRISAIEKLEEERLFITKGDANQDTDNQRVNKELVVGKVILTLPFIGYAVSFARTIVGLMLLVVIPATIIVYSEAIAIKREIFKIRRKDRNKKKFFKKYSLKKLLGLAWFLIVIQTSGTSSSYIDIETSTGNTMAAGVWGEGVDEERVELLFYLRQSDDSAVGFSIQGVSGYDSLEYVIEYEHDGGILEHVEGVIDNSGHSDAFLREWFELATCSNGNLVCVYHQDIPEVNLQIDLLIGVGIAETLNRTITL